MPTRGRSTIFIHRILRKDTLVLEDIENNPLPSLHRLPTIRRRESTSAHTSLEITFIEYITGRKQLTLDAAAKSYLSHFKSAASARWQEDFDRILVRGANAPTTPYEKCLRLSCRVMDVLRDKGAIAIIRIIMELRTRDVLEQGDGNSGDWAAQYLIFSVIGWISMLFVPAPFETGISRSDSNHFRIVPQSTGNHMRSTVTNQKAARPLDELFRSFGDLLPKNEQIPPGPRERSNPILETKLQVSYLNVSALKTLANMKIVWVDNLGAHLDFDPTTPALSLFRHPSMCALQNTQDSILSILLNDFYQLGECPSQGALVPQMMNEVRLSYHLLFKDDRRARREYVNHERHLACSTLNSVKPLVDVVLDDVCGRGIPSMWSSVFSGTVSGTRDSYDMDADFPIFKDRLKRLQDYMEGLSPNRFMSLWRDRRDLRLWYTIWTVIILGVIGIVEQTIGLILAGLQVDIAQQSFDLQKQQQG